MQRIAAFDVEIEPMVAAAQAVERVAGAGKPAQRLARMLQIGGFERADRFDGFELLKFIELVELQKTLLGKGDLIHGERGDLIDWETGAAT